MSVLVHVHTGRFDSTLHIVHGNAAANLVLTVEMRLFLQRIGTTTFHQGGITFRTRPWTDPEWNFFTMMVRNLGETFWNDRYWLQPPDGFDMLNLPLDKPAYRPNLKCRLKIQVLAADKKTDAHSEVRAVHLADDENRFFRSDAVTWSHRDSGYRTLEHGVHYTMVHELGHLLGLDHPGLRTKVAACVRDGNQDICYDDAQPTVGGETMGGGHGFIPDYATPWQLAAALHVKGHVGMKQWKVLMQDAPPKYVGYNPVPRTVTPSKTVAPPSPILSGGLVDPFNTP